MKLYRVLIVGVLGLSAYVSSASATLAIPTVLISGAGSSSLFADSPIGLLPVGSSQGLVGDAGFSVTGPFTFQTGTANPPSVTYSVWEPIILATGSYQTSTYLNVDISDSAGSSASGYLQDYQVITQLYTDAQLTNPVADSYSSGGQLDFPTTGYGPSGTDPFCALATCGGISSGSASSLFFGGSFNVVGGVYFLGQTLTATVVNVDPTATITFTMPDSSGVGTATPEPTFWGVLSVGLIGLALARRRYAAKA